MSIKMQRVVAENTNGSGYPEPLRITWCKHSVHHQYWTPHALCQVTWGDYLCLFSPTEPNPPRKGRMDPTGFEPVSATWTECYVPVTPRALHGVSAMTGDIARLLTAFFPGLVPNRDECGASRQGQRSMLGPAARHDNGGHLLS